MKEPVTRIRNNFKFVWLNWTCQNTPRKKAKYDPLSKYALFFAWSLPFNITGWSLIFLENQYDTTNFFHITVVAQ